MPILRWLILTILMACLVWAEIDPYKELNVPTHATKKEIRASYKKLALKYHPDKKANSANAERMARINGAFEILGDDKKRKEYDASRQRHSFDPWTGRRHTSQNSEDGLGAKLTSSNAHDFLYSLADSQAWLILACEDFNSQCKVARSVFEDTCVKLYGIAHCGKFNVNRDMSLVSEFGIRRVPSFVAFFYDSDSDKQHSKLIKYHSNLKPNQIINQMRAVFSDSIVNIQSTADVDTFLDSNNPSNNVKLVCFSDHRSFAERHINLGWLWNRYKSSSIEIGYHYMVSKSKSVQLIQHLLIDIDSVETPSLFIFRNTLATQYMIEMCGNQPLSPSSSSSPLCDSFQSLEDIGIYHLSQLSADISEMSDFVNQYSRPLLPQIDGSNFLEYAYLSNDDNSKLDRDALLFIFGLQLSADSDDDDDNRSKELSKIAFVTQSILARLDEPSLFGWIDCVAQSAFCEPLHLIPNNKRQSSQSQSHSTMRGGGNDVPTFELSAIIANRDKAVLFDSKDSNCDTLQCVIERITQWIVNVQTSVMEGSDSESINQIIEKKALSDVKWRQKVNIEYPLTLIVNKGDNSDYGGLLGGIYAMGGSVLEVFSSLSQLIFLLFLFLMVLPMLRGL